MQPGRRFERRGMRTRAFTKSENFASARSSCSRAIVTPGLCVRAPTETGEIARPLERGGPDPETKHAETAPTSAGFDIDDIRATERNRASGTGERRVQAFEKDEAINLARANYHVRIPGDGEG